MSVTSERVNVRPHFGSERFALSLSLLKSNPPPSPSSAGRIDPVGLLRSFSLLLNGQQRSGGAMGLRGRIYRRRGLGVSSQRDGGAGDELRSAEGLAVRGEGRPGPPGPSGGEPPPA